MAPAAFFPRAPQGYPLIEQYIVANSGGLADDSAHAMVNEAAATNDRAGMYLDTCQETTKMG
jgi:hypothetical protein